MKKSTNKLEEYPYIISSFEKLTLFSKKNYHIFWIFIAIFSIIGSTIVLTIYNEKLYLITQFTIVFSIFLWPIVYIWLSKSFYVLWKNHLKCLYWNNEKESYKWYKINANNTFVFFNKRNLYITLPLFIFAIITIFFLLEPPFNTHIVNYIALFGLVIILLISFFSFNIILSTFLPLIDYANFNPLKNYFSDGYMHFKEIKDFYLKTLWLLIFINITLFFGFIFSPYFSNGNTPLILIIWIIFISCWPTVLYFLVIYFLRKIEVKLKENFIIQYDEKILKNIRFETNNDDIETIKEKIELKKYLLNYKYDEQKVAAIFLSIIPVITAIIQLCITFFK